MSELYMMTAIITRDRTKEFAAFYDRYNVPVNFITLGNGTATNELMDYFGLDGTEKAVIFSVVTRKTWKTEKRSGTGNAYRHSRHRRRVYHSACKYRRPSSAPFPDGGRDL